MMNWQPKQIKPKPYKPLLLRLVGGPNNYTTGWWASKAKRGKGCWAGLAFNQSLPVYELLAGAVTHWCEITEPGEE